MKLSFVLAVALLAAVPLLAAPGAAVAPLPLTVVATDFQFAPLPLVVPTGSTVTWIQGTATFMPHTVTSAGFHFAPGDVGAGGVIASRTFNEPSGTVITYLCMPHAMLGMRGVIVVV